MNKGRHLEDKVNLALALFEEARVTQLFFVALNKIFLFISGQRYCEQGTLFFFKTMNGNGGCAKYVL